VLLYAPTQTGPNIINGLLLTWYNNNWGTVCDDVTDCNDPRGGGSAHCNNNYVNVAGGRNLAAVVCCSLGNTGGEEYNANGASSGYPIVVDGTANHITGSDARLCGSMSPRATSKQSTSPSNQKSPAWSMRTFWNCPVPLQSLMRYRWGPPSSPGETATHP